MLKRQTLAKLRRSSVLPKKVLVDFTSQDILQLMQSERGQWLRTLLSGQSPFLCILCDKIVRLTTLEYLVQMLLFDLWYDKKCTVRGMCHNFWTKVSDFRQSHGKVGYEIPD